jgi:hypothetical protein
MLYCRRLLVTGLHDSSLSCCFAVCSVGTDLSPLDALTVAILLASIWLLFVKVPPIKEFSRIVFLIAVFFWAWAVKNTIKIGFDLGILSFWLVGIATYLHWRTQRGDITFTRFTIGFVLFNYFLGIVLGHTKLRRRDFVVYCAVNLGFWGVIMSKF